MSSRVLDFENYTAKARQAVAEGQVLLQNQNHVLPLPKGSHVAVFGRMQLHYYKSGTGSGGMVNVNKVTGILEALEESEDVQVYEPLVDVYREWEKDHPFDEGVGWGNEPWSQEEMELNEALVEEAAEKNEYAIVILARTAGEDKDNKMLEGAYCLTSIEEDMLQKVRKNFAKMIVLLNTGNIMDMSFMDQYRPDAVMYVWQGGMIGGLGTVDVLTGKVCPSGRLSDTIAAQMSDYPANPYFGGLEQNLYVEDIYVGYRYFESVAKSKVLYPFGFGLSYTTFSMEADRFSYAENQVSFVMKVTNTGSVAGKEVVQVYAKAPLGKLGKPARVLIDFKKTKELKPGESEELAFAIPTSVFASYNEVSTAEMPTGWVLEAGEYTIYAGGNVRDAYAVGSFTLDELQIVEECRNALAPTPPFKRMKMTAANEHAEAAGVYEIAMEEVPLRVVSPEEKRNAELPESYEMTGDRGIKLADVKVGKATLDEFVAQLSEEELASIVRGEGMGSPKVTAGTAAAFGGVTKSLLEKGIPCGCCDDGPSGMRLDSGMKAFSLPNGTLLACTFNTQLNEELYAFTAVEMIKNRVDILLGPGMNIHRHPLNGRNFEYFSEDPLLTGKMAAAQVRGLKSAGVTGSLKHFCGNNQETRRHTSNSIASERALREIYLRGFEIAVKEAKADAVMTTYGPVNGIWTSSNYDLVTDILRKQWGFEGVVMTDWWAYVCREGDKPAKTDFATMVKAQNDLYMVCPDSEKNEHGDNTVESLHDGSLTLGELQRCAKNICRFMMNTHAFMRMQNEEDTIEILGAEEGFEECVGDLTYYKVDKEVVIDLSDHEISKGTSIDFALDLEQLGYYKAELTAKSDLGERAQIPVTLSFAGTPRGVYTFNGTNGQWVTQTREADLGMKYAIMRLYFPQNGIEVKQIKFVYDRPFE
ncbi:MAG: glycoside hydrolase family 3 C-terminal domain-containing protein [Lachnospiraceae bacterium]|nr:glycoside hydrolase family 3 C-terminal domain-containing protein [Lachnospiraceae bacterium]